jgi:hypothetical protein
LISSKSIIESKEGNMTESKYTPREHAPTREWLANILMLVAAVAAFYAFITGIGVALASGPDTQQVQWWRVLGYLMFTGLFILLAYWPRRYPGLWELLIADKALLTIVEIFLIRNHAADAVTTAEADGILTVILVASYLLSRGYSSWKK